MAEEPEAAEWRVAAPLDEFHQQVLQVVMAYGCMPLETLQAAARILAGESQTRVARAFAAGRGGGLPEALKVINESVRPFGFVIRGLGPRDGQEEVVGFVNTVEDEVAKQFGASHLDDKQLGFIKTFLAAYFAGELEPVPLDAILTKARETPGLKISASGAATTLRLLAEQRWVEEDDNGWVPGSRAYLELRPVMLRMGQAEADLPQIIYY